MEYSFLDFRQCLSFFANMCLLDTANWRHVMERLHFSWSRWPDLCFQGKIPGWIVWLCASPYNQSNFAFLSHHFAHGVHFLPYRCRSPSGTHLFSKPFSGKLSFYQMHKGLRWTCIRVGRPSWSTCIPDQWCQSHRCATLYRTVCNSRQPVTSVQSTCQPSSIWSPRYRQRGRSSLLSSCNVRASSLWEHQRIGSNEPQLHSSQNSWPGRAHVGNHL